MKRLSVAALFAAMVLAAALVGGCRSTYGQNAVPASDDLQESPAVAHPEVAGLRVVSREQIDPPTPAYAFRLVDQFGERVGLSDWRGRVVVVSFIYTNCPEACPLLARYYLSLQERLGEAVDADELELVLITTDPKRDTPERLRVYTTDLGGKWSFLSGEYADLEKVWARYEIHREVRERVQEIVVYHSYKTYLIDREGRLRVKYVGIWDPDWVEADLSKLLAEP